MNETSKLEGFLNSRHEEVIARQSDWDFYLRSYIGGRQYMDGRNLFSHRLEHRSDASRRLSRSYYINHCRNVVDMLTALLFSKGFSVDPVPPQYLAADTDRRGGDLTQVMRRAATLSSIFGHAFILVDMPKASDQAPRNRRDELFMGIRPYLELVAPSEVVNWETDDWGAPLWCLMREKTGTREFVPEDSQASEDSREEVYRLWTRQTWHLYGKRKEKWTILEEGEHGLGVVPLVPLKHQDLDGGVCGDSMLRDVAILNREVYNLSSLLQEIIYRQTFGQLVAQGSAEEYVGEEETLSKLGTSSIFLYPDNRDAPSYISPNPANAEILVSQIDRLVSEIYRICNLHAPDWLEGQAAVESGVARSYRYINTEGALREKACGVSDAFEKALWIASVWEGNEREYTVSFPKQLGVPRAE